MNHRVLFVDDETNILLAYRRNMRNHFDVTVAESGIEAIEIIQNQEPFAVVISDYRMPEMDGIEFLNKVKEISPDTVRIILTGFADMQTAIDAINEGNIFRFLTKPIHNDKLVQAIKDAAEQYRLVTSEKELNKKLAEAYSTIKNDLETAAELQHYFLPENDVVIGKCKLNWEYLPSVFVSGDTFNYFSLDENKIAFYIIDVAGHGLPAAFLSVSLSRTLVPTYGGHSILKKVSPISKKVTIAPPAKAIKALNERFLSRGKNAEYFTMIYGIVDTAENKVTLCQAGHPSPIVIRRGGNVDMVGQSSFPVGILPEADYNEQSFPFMPGDKLFLYTDGITECAGITKKNEIQSKVMEFLGQASNGRSNKEMFSELLINLKKWSQTEEYPDDVSMLMIERIIEE